MLSGKVALITGSSSGIGRATALIFAKEGASLTITGRNEEKLLETKSQCEDVATRNVKILAVVGDLNKEEDAKEIVYKTIDYYKKIDVLVNNAGIVQRGSIQNTSLEQYDSVMNTNVRSVFQLTQMCLSHLIQSKGNIVNVSSVNGIRAFPGVLSYCLSKSTLDQFTSCLALELADKQVRVNSVNPGAVDTNIFLASGLNEKQKAEFLERCKSTHPLGRVATPEEVGRAITFLASDWSTFTTGEKLSVDGGRQLATQGALK